MHVIWPHGDPHVVARAILGDPRYRQSVTQAAPSKSWIDSVLEWIGGLLRAVLHGLDRALGVHNPFEAAIGVAVIGAACALAGYLCFAMVRSYARRARARRPAGIVASASTLPETAAALRASARTAAGAGRLRVAAALLFFAAARALDEAGRVVYDPARTPGDYRRLLRDPLFDVFAGDASLALFAAAEPTGELWERMSATYDRFFAGAYE